MHIKYHISSSPVFEYEFYHLSHYLTSMILSSTLQHHVGETQRLSRDWFCKLCGDLRVGCAVWNGSRCWGMERHGVERWEV